MVTQNWHNTHYISFNRTKMTVMQLQGTKAYTTEWTGWAVHVTCHVVNKLNTAGSHEVNGCSGTSYRAVTLCLSYLYKSSCDFFKTRVNEIIEWQFMKIYYTSNHHNRCIQMVRLGLALVQWYSWSASGTCLSGKFHVIKSLSQLGRRN